MRRSLSDSDYKIVRELFVYKDGEIQDKKGRKYKSQNLAGYVVFSKRISETEILSDYIHRLVFLYHNAFLPHHVDHVNRIKWDNRIENLRAATSSSNALNCKLSINNKSGINGVYFDKSRNKWVGKIKINNKNIGTKRFDTIEEATEHRKYLEDLYCEFDL